MHPDRDHNIGLDRWKLTSNCSVSRSLPQRDLSPSVSECSGLVAVTVAMAVITGDDRRVLRHAESAYNKKRTRLSKLFRSGVSLYPYLAIFFLLAGTPSVVRAQAQNENTTVPSVSTPTDNIGPLPTPPEIVTSIVTPSISPMMTQTTTPTLSPSLPPTKSMRPSSSPTKIPSTGPTMSPKPTGSPSEPPSNSPSFASASLKLTKFRQEFQVGNGREFNEDEILLFQTIYQQYTAKFSPLPATESDSKITTICTVDKQSFLVEVGERWLQEDDTLGDATPQLLWRLGRSLQDAPSNPIDEKTLNVDFTMMYESSYYNVTQYPKLFQNWTNSNLPKVLEQMQLLNLNVTKVDPAKRIVRSTPVPTLSPFPSTMPTFYPTTSPGPTLSQNDEPTIIPNTISSEAPVEANGTGSYNIVIISVSFIIALSILVIGLFFYCRKRKANQPDNLGLDVSKRSQGREGSQVHAGMRWTGSTSAVPNQSFDTPEAKAYGSSYGRHPEVPSRLADAISSPPGSLVSSQSLISRGNSMGGDSGDEEDSAHVLVDEFDQYKDQNLEKMRADIEDLPECDGMMSQAVARALIDQDDEVVISGSYWGGDHDITAPEIEASALGLVSDWLRRNGKASDREKREMLQEQLNKMTASVLHKVIGPDDATRTIHECAVLLGLKLASELSATTILISGMRKKATEADIRRTFSVFGDVAVAAVAPNERGFGILRFNSNNGVKRAMSKFRVEEVVVEDVAVQLVMIEAGSKIANTEKNGAPEII